MIKNTDPAIVWMCATLCAFIATIAFLLYWQVSNNHEYRLACISAGKSIVGESCVRVIND